MARESFVKIFLLESELTTVRLAAAVVGSRSVSKFCRDLIVAEAERITAPLNIAAARKVATQRGKPASSAEDKSGRR